MYYLFIHTHTHTSWLAYVALPAPPRRPPADPRSLELLIRASVCRWRDQSTELSDLSRAWGEKVIDEEAFGNDRRSRRRKGNDNDMMMIMIICVSSSSIIILCYVVLYYNSTSTSTSNTNIIDNNNDITRHGTA